MQINGFYDLYTIWIRQGYRVLLIMPDQFMYFNLRNNSCDTKQLVIDKFIAQCKKYKLEKLHTAQSFYMFTKMEGLKNEIYCRCTKK